MWQTQPAQARAAAHSSWLMPPAHAAAQVSEGLQEQDTASSAVLSDALRSIVAAVQVPLPSASHPWHAVACAAFTPRTAEKCCAGSRVRMSLAIASDAASPCPGTEQLRAGGAVAVPGWWTRS